MKLGEKKTITMEAKDAYGEKDPTKKQGVDKKDLKDLIEKGVKLEKGKKLTNPYGQEFEIIAIDDKTITLDGNHPLAGKKLIFEIEMVSIN